jgi:nitrogen regulatory protein A
MEAVIMCLRGASGVVSDYSPLANALETYREMLELDYAAIAKVDERDNQIRYECVTGNRTNRHVHFVNRPGNGIAGHVVRHGRPAVYDRNRPDLPDLKMKYPIMLAEKLEAVLAVPIFHDEIVSGVLLGAVRRERAFLDEEVDLAKRHAEEMAPLLRIVNARA